MRNRWVSRAADIVAEVLTHECCPWANRWVAGLGRPLPVLMAAGAAALACGIFVRAEAFAALAAVAAVAAVGFGWPVVVVRLLRCDVGFGRSRCVVGEAVSATVRIRNAWPWPIWGLRVECDGAMVAVARVGGGQTETFACRFVPAARGDYPLVRPRLVTGFPFGLKEASVPARVEHRIVVWPATVPLDSVLEAVDHSGSDEATVASRSGNSGDISGTRWFRSGDSLRRVHWPLTARTGKLVVCDRHAGISASARIVLDVDPGAYVLAGEAGGGQCGKDSAGTPQNVVFESAVRIVASLGLAYLSRSAVVELVCGGTTVRAVPGAGGERRLLDALALVALHRFSTIPVRARCAGVEIVVTAAARVPRLARVLARHPRRAWVFVGGNGKSSPVGGSAVLAERDPASTGRSASRVIRPARHGGWQLRVPAGTGDLKIFKVGWKEACRGV